MIMSAGLSLIWKILVDDATSANIGYSSARPLRIGILGAGRTAPRFPRDGIWSEHHFDQTRPLRGDTGIHELG
jgi:hypothetical protein